MNIEHQKKVSATDRPRKTVPVPDEVYVWFVAHYNSYLTKKDAVEAIGIGYRACEDIISKKTCSPDTLAHIESLKNAA